MEENSNNFYRKVYDIVKQIPTGKVTTYGSIAVFLGSKSSARLVGMALNAARDTDIPAHRVVNRLGELTGKRFFATPELMKDFVSFRRSDF
jgi:methylated-DNA-protein-cysteine methyltransferase-like protein